MTKVIKLKNLEVYNSFKDRLQNDIVVFLDAPEICIVKGKQSNTISSIPDDSVLENTGNIVTKDSLKGSSYGQITSFEGELTYASFEEADELNYVSAVGALLWKASDGSLVATNGDSSASDYWDPKSNTVTTPTKDGYTLIGVCCGYGKWVYTSWIGLTTTYKWAVSSTDNLYKWQPTMVHGHGYENTMHVLNNHSEILTGTLWEQVKSVRDTGMPIFIPSKYELLDCQENICDDNHSAQSEGTTSSQICSYNKNLGKLLSCNIYSYWSSSLNSNNYDHAFNCNFYYGSLNNYKKSSNSYHTLALLHFGA